MRQLSLTAAAGAAVLGLAVIPVATPSSASAAITEDAHVRLSGGDRYGTAVDITQEAFPDGADVVYVASGEQYADALAGAAAAAANSAPVMLVAPTSVPDVVKTELSRLAPAEVVVVGGVNAVSDAVLAEVAALTDASARRIGGGNRYETAALVAREFTDPASVYVASGEDFPDALAAAAAAGAAGAPVLLTEADSTSDELANALRELRPATTRIVGGPTAVSGDLDAAVPGLTGGTVERLAGDNRYDTAATVARTQFADDAAPIFVASGEDFPDALSGAAVAGGLGAPLVLVPRASLPPTTAQVIADLAPAGTVVLGGDKAISPGVAEAVAQIAESGEVPPAPQPADAFDQRMVELINVEREKAGVPPLRYAPSLRAGALAHSQAMFAAGELFHDNERIAADVAAARCSGSWGENVYRALRSTADTEAAVAAAITTYMDSPEHAANILRPQFAYVAIGTVVRDGTVYNTQRFAGSCE